MLYRHQAVYFTCKMSRLFTQVYGIVSVKTVQIKVGWFAEFRGYVLPRRAHQLAYQRIVHFSTRHVYQGRNLKTRILLKKKPFPG